MNILVKMTDQNKIDDLKEQFQKIDTDGTGLIDANELKTAIKNSNYQIPDEKIDEIIDEVDYFGNNQINYTEFLVATMDVKNFLDDSKL
jgi:Ca2+-binding EF-hand superfamily protein